MPGDWYFNSMISIYNDRKCVLLPILIAYLLERVDSK